MSDQPKGKDAEQEARRKAGLPYITDEGDSRQQDGKGSRPQFPRDRDDNEKK